jgi:opacity protein-like surface antigen
MITMPFRAVPRGQAAAESRKSAGAARRYGRGMATVTGVALAASLFAVSGAQAQNCGTLGVPAVGNLVGLIGSAVGAGAALSSSITAANTAFLTQSTAFVSAPPNPQPGQEGGGVWVRGVAGDLNLKSTSTLNGTVTVPGFPAFSGSGGTSCATKFHETYGGVQVGSDVARLNFDGWNVHLGTTAGAMWSSGDIVGGSPLSPAILGPTTQTPFNTKSQSPFVGTYAVATKGSFFADALIRYDNYDLNMNSPGLNLFNQKDDAHGISISGSVGYNYQVPNSKWFVEPSAGVIWSRTKVGALNVNTPFFGFAGFSGTGQINDITSTIGRAGLRVGTTVEAGNIVYQPFVAASVWHDFAGNITGSYQSCANCLFVFGVPSTINGTISTTNVGTFGQYSVGVSGQVVNTGWLGFARLDYRDGDKLQSLSGTAGIRYQFTPDLVVASHVMPVKAPVFKAPVMTPVSWTGFYVGGIAGADFGRSEFIVPGLAGADLHPSGVLLGGTVGYNYQIDKYVLGIEADDSWTNYRGSAACSPLITGVATTPAFFQTTCRDTMSWIATVTGRAGYLFGPRTLGYLKAGVAFGQETWSVTCNYGPLNGTVAGPALQACNNPAGAPLNYISARDTRVGGTIGYGIEFALTQNWSAKGEFDWMDFGSKTLIASDGTAFTAKQWSVSEVKVGLNYHFNTGPIAAKY